MSGSHFTYRPASCPNCGYPLQGNEKYCPNCGQSTGIRRIRLRQYVKDVFQSFIQLENKTLRTLLDLLRAPGRTAKAYVEGKRISYTNPFRLLIVTGMVYFLLLLWSGSRSHINAFDQNPEIETDLQNRPVATEVIRRLDSLNYTMHWTDSLQNTSEKIQRDRIAKRVLSHLSYPGKDTPAGLAAFNRYVNTFLDDYVYLPGWDTLAYMPFEKRAEIMFRTFSYEPFRTASWKALAENFDGAPKRFLWEVNFFQKLSALVLSKEKQQNFMRQFYSQITFSLLLVLPLVALWAWLLFARSGYNLAEVMVLIFYLQSLYFLFLIVGLLFSFWPLGQQIVSNGLNLLFIYYLIKSFAVFFQRPFRSTAWKVIFLVIPVYLIFMAAGLMLTGLWTVWKTG